MAEKIYNKLEIDKINAQHTAEVDAIITDNLGNKYIGTTDNNLQLLQPAENTPISRVGNMTSTRVAGLLGEVDERISAIEDDYVTEAELAQAKRDSACFATSMAIIL